MSWCSPVLPGSSRHIQGLAPRLFLTPQMQAGAAVNIFFLGGKKKSPQVLAGSQDRGAEGRGNCVDPCKTSQTKSLESPVAHSVLEMLHHLLPLYFSTGRIRDPSLLGAQQPPSTTARC